MRITIVIPVNIDEPLERTERDEFETYLQQAAEPIIREFASKEFGEGARMYDTVCRFSFSKPKIEIS